MSNENEKFVNVNEKNELKTEINKRKREQGKQCKKIRQI
jgi:hypothetical protein